MAKGEIGPRFVGKVDQDLAAARSNLVKHVADVRRMLADGETTEVVFMHFAQMMLRETNAFHTALMFSAAVLTLTEREQVQGACDMRGQKCTCGWCDDCLAGNTT